MVGLRERNLAREAVSSFFVFDAERCLAHPHAPALPYRVGNAACLRGRRFCLARLFFRNVRVEMPAGLPEADSRRHASILERFLVVENPRGQCDARFRVNVCRNLFRYVFEEIHEFGVLEPFDVHSPKPPPVFKVEEKLLRYVLSEIDDEMPVRHSVFLKLQFPRPGERLAFVEVRAYGCNEAAELGLPLLVGLSRRADTFGDRQRDEQAPGEIRDAFLLDQLALGPDTSVCKPISTVVVLNQETIRLRGSHRRSPPHV